MNNSLDVEYKDGRRSATFWQAYLLYWNSLQIPWLVEQLQCISMNELFLSQCIVTNLKYVISLQMVPYVEKKGVRNQMHGSECIS